MTPYAAVSPAIHVLRMIRGNGGTDIKTAAHRATAAHLVFAGYARRLKRGWTVTATGMQLLARLDPQNRYGDTGAW